MRDKSPIQKLQDAVVEGVSEVVADPRAAAGKAVQQVRGVVSVGLTVAGQVAGEVAKRLSGADEPTAPARPAQPRPHLQVADEPVDPADEAGTTAPARTPNDVARVVGKKAPPPKKAAPSTPSDKLPLKKAPAKKAAAKKAATQKAPARKAPAKKAPAKKAPAKKAPAKKVAPPETEA